MFYRRDFLKGSAILAVAGIFPGLFEVASAASVASTPSDFTLWQLPLHQSPAQGNSYVFRTTKGKVIVMDGGVPDEAGYLRGFLAALGNEVEAWFLSHPHTDHIGALHEILKKPDGIKINSIYHSEFSKEFYEKVEPQAMPRTIDFYDRLKKRENPATNIQEPGLVIDIDNVKFKILAVKNEELTVNAYNNSSMVIRVWDSVRSVLFLGDAGAEEGDKILLSPFRNELDSDFVQMAHHGQRGVRKEFYQSFKFKACLWPTPLWLYNNDQGKGFNTANFETVKTREWMKEAGIQKHFVSADGLYVID
ncbi:MAG: MBL fold metallo-hydrolase [Planctomycetaceae bacterium]|jgi:hypothetical protein|nr:MBL fold metallo-hydrolase [Planctomycetaceae bacterium]